MAPSPHRRARRSWRRVTVISALCLGVWGLAYVLPAPALATVSGQITYSTDWAWGDAIPLASGGWQTTSDLGYTVQVTDGMIVNRSVTTNECPHSHSLFSWIVELLLPQRAYAGHGTDADLARVYESFAESLTTLSAHTWGTVTVGEPTYCEGHYLIAVADDTTTDAPASLLGNSLMLQAQVSLPDSVAPLQIALVTDQAWGALHPLTTPDGVAVHAAISGEAVGLTLTRRLDTLFDGIHFAEVATGAMSETDLIRALLRNLANQTTITITQGRIHAAG